MRMAAPFLVALVLLAGMAPATAVTHAPADDPSDAVHGDRAATAADRPALGGPVPHRIDEPLLTKIYIAPDPGGDARWRISVTYNLSSDAARAAFDRYARAFEAGDAEAGFSVEFFRRLATEAGRSTNREMSIRNPERNATVRNGTGVLRLSFTWTNFVTDTPNGFEIQDATLMPGNRTWLASIGPSQRLVVETPPGYQVTDTRFGLDNGSVVIQGPHTFREPLSISYREVDTGPEVRPEPESTPWLLVGGAILLGLSLVAAAVYVRRREGGEPQSTAEEVGEAESAVGATGDAAEEASEAGSDAEAPEAETPATEAEGETAPESEAEEPDPESGSIDPTLLSDEERVEHLIERNGGRMKQARIVQETGWSDAKVSQLLSTMADDGRVEKLRLGRENLISLVEDGDESGR
ncbi:MAG: hypothetical protein ABEI80_07125 [Haloplanus sp.]